MSYQPPLPNTGVILPVPGSGQAWEVAVYNGNFTGVENAIAADRTRLTTIEGKIGNNALIPAGTSAARDGFYGSPTTAAGRIALANSAPRWFNTEKGYLERYFAPTSDSATGGYNTLFARGAGGWLSAESGLVPLSLAAAAVSGGGTIAVNGNVLVMTNANTVVLDSFFTAAFDQYEVYFDVSLSVSGFLNWIPRIGGVDQNSASSVNRQVSSTIGTTPGGATQTDNTFKIGHVASTSFAGKGTYYNPASSGRVAQMDSLTQRNDGHGRQTNQTVAAGVFDGVKLQGSGGGSMSGQIRIFGVAGGHI